MRFADILGHSAQKEALKAAFARDRLHHAYLFAGPDGIGKRRIAYALAARALCSSPDLATNDACGQCRHCRRVLATPDYHDEHGPFTTKDDAPQLAPKHPDVLALVPHGQYIKMEQVREMLRVVPYQPVEGQARFVIIDPVDSLHEAAANALLKTLEEPPRATRFILLTNAPANVLVTIRSRCQRIAMGRLADADLATILTRKGIDADTIARVLPLAQGSARLAVDLVQDPVLQIWDDLAARVLALDPQRQPSELLELAAALAELPNREGVFDRLARLLRDALLLATVPDAAHLFHERLRAPLWAWASTRSGDAIMQRLRIAEDTRLAVRTFNVGARLAFERLLFAIGAPAGREIARPYVDFRDVL
ncbi:MAG: DNA polymerase III subunit [Myxococcota bacterium]